MKVFVSAKEELVKRRKDKIRNKTEDNTWTRVMGFMYRTSQYNEQILTHFLKVHTSVIVVGRVEQAKRFHQL
jgi:hypothetical protein